MILNTLSLVTILATTPPLLPPHSRPPDTEVLPDEQPALDATAPLALFTWADFDGDGLVDAFVIQPDGGAHLLRNRGDGSFEDQTERRGLRGIGKTKGPGPGPCHSQSDPACPPPDQNPP